MTLYYKIKNAWRDLTYDFRTRCQRFKRGYSYGDVWDMDIWFKSTVKPMLIYLRDHGIGMPGELYNEDEDTRKPWEDILTEMINCLELMDEDNAQKHVGVTDDDHSFESWERVYACMDSNKNRFFELFSKYFYSLWD